jgi:hypothetical protein
MVSGVRTEMLFKKLWWAWLGRTVRARLTRYGNAVAVDYEFAGDRVRRLMFSEARLMRPPRSMIAREEWLAVKCKDGRVILFPKGKVREVEELPHRKSPRQSKHYA